MIFSEDAYKLAWIAAMNFGPDPDEPSNRESIEWAWDLLTDCQRWIDRKQAENKR